jgi:hypothetical protein
MAELSAPDLRSNLATWAVPVRLLPAVSGVLHDVLPNEVFDPHFRGQFLETTYFDTQDLRLRKARLRKDRYLTLRLRCYPGEVYALSAKTEGEKARVEVDPAHAEAVLDGRKPLEDMVARHLPAHFLARLAEIAGDANLQPVVTVCCRRYAVEDDEERYTLDVCVATDLGKKLPFAVLEYKSMRKDDAPPNALITIPIRPIKLSKFIWATEA